MTSLFRKNDNLIEWTWLRKATTGEYVNDGTVTFTLYSGYSLNPATGALVTPAGDVNVLVYGPITMSYVTGSNGKYQGTLPASIDLDLSLAYTLEINGVAGGYTARRSIPIPVTDRTT